MSYRTIVVHVDRAPNSTARIEIAAQLAMREGAHLVGAAMTGVPRYMLAGSPYEGSGVLIANHLRQASERATAALARFEEIASRIGVQHEQRRHDLDEYSGLCLQARYADLLVLGQADPDDHEEGGLLLDLPEQVLMHGGRPVLLVPRSGSFTPPARHALVAWNGSREAARAVSAALPLLQQVGQVTLAVLGAGQGDHGEEPGADIALYLARHEIKVNVLVQPRPADAGKAILALASELGADLLVMGAYGHSRWREMVLGGATRTILAQATLPVLLMH
jgi:nucleotide-binding universal stress UspA family protein